MRTVALDLGKKKTTYCEVADGKVIDRTTVSRVSHLERKLGPQQPPARVAIEACRDAWFVHDLLTSWNNEVLVLDTTRVRRLGIGQHGRKTDRIDAEVLAMAVAGGRLPLAHVLSEHRRELRELLCMRRALVQTRSKLTSQIRALLQARGTTLPSCKAHDLGAFVSQFEMEPELRMLIAPLLSMLAPLEVQVAEVEERLHALCAGEEVVERLATVPGVAIIVAAAFVSVIDDAHRFRRASHVASYLGLVPAERSTGGKRKLGAITKQGNAPLRALLVQSAWTVLRSKDDDPLTRWAHAVAERRGKRIAVVAVARRLARLMWAVWRDGSCYDPAHLGLKSASGLRTHAQGLQRRAEATEAEAKKLLKAKRKLAAQRRASGRRAERAQTLLAGGAVASS